LYLRSLKQQSHLMDKPIYQRISHFEGLNGLRFIAAFLVVMHHSETIRKKYGLLHLEDFTLFRNGFNAVSFFFVLSGFLITYLLLKERKQTSSISIRHFYVRRILRIWPLYFLLVIIGTLLVPFLINVVGYNYQFPYTFGQVWFYFLFFMPFMVNILFGHHIIEPLWSIGVEELFYMFWAPFSKYTQNKYLFFIFAVIVIKVVLSILCLTILKDNIVLCRCVSMLQFEAMAIGALGAYWVFNRTEEISVNFLFSKPFQILVLAMLIAKLGFNSFLSTNSFTMGVYNSIFNVPDFSTILLYCLFLWIVINVALNNRRLFGLENKAMDTLGDISYGIYMYHMLLIFAFILAGKQFLSGFNIYVASLIYYPIIGSAVIIVSYFSKKYMEDKFLDLKRKFI
jgi:peptidoglycan/LPS O-acetylase OafA/YrhL